MKVTETFNVQIWVGLRIGYSDKNHSLNKVRFICDRYVNEIKQCVTITPTEYHYVDGNEDGAIIGFINYPRFPKEGDEIIDRAFALAEKLMVGLDQKRVSVVTPFQTYMLENEEIDDILENNQ